MALPGTLTLSSGMTLGGATSGNPSNLTFNVNSTLADIIALGGPLTVNPGGANIHLHSLSVGAITSGTAYTIITGSGFTPGTGRISGRIDGSGRLSFGVNGTLNVTPTTVQVITNVIAAPSAGLLDRQPGNAME